MRRVATGHYDTWFRGHHIELIDLSTMGGKREWIAPIDGENDIEPRRTRKEAWKAAMREINKPAT